MNVNNNFYFKHSKAVDDLDRCIPANHKRYFCDYARYYCNPQETVS